MLVNPDFSLYCPQIAHFRIFTASWRFRWIVWTDKWSALVDDFGYDDVFTDGLRGDDISKTALFFGGGRHCVL
jgi:hypothetical protein